MNSHKRLTEIHIEHAKSRALRLIAFTGAVFPREWGTSWDEVIVPDLLEFGFHARKVNEFCGLLNENFPTINKKIVKISEGDPGNWEENYRHALNAILHMKSFVLGHVHADHRKIFQQAESNLITTYIRVETDKFQEVTISIFGLVNCFLRDVIPKIREKDSNLRF